MKTFKRIHNIFTAVAIITAMYIGSGVDATRSDIAWSYIIFFTTVASLVARFIYEDRREEKNSL